MKSLFQLPPRTTASLLEFLLVSTRSTYCRFLTPGTVTRVDLLSQTSRNLSWSCAFWSKSIPSNWGHKKRLQKSRSLINKMSQDNPEIEAILAPFRENVKIQVGIMCKIMMHFFSIFLSSFNFSID